MLLHQWNAGHGSKIPSAVTNGYAITLMLDHFGTDTLAMLTPERQERFVSVMRQAGYKDSTTNRHVTILRASIRRAWKRGALLAMPFIAGVEENEPKPKHIFTADQFAEFLDRAWGIEHLFRFTMISANTLSRPCAVFDLTPFQVSFEHGHIDLNLPGRKQTKKYRPMVPLTETLKPWLRYWTGSPIVNWGGKPIDDIGRSFSVVGKQMGIEGLTPYAIRHTMATELAKRGVPKEQRDRFMGHKARDGSKTGERYVHFEPAWLVEAKNAIDAYFDALPVHFSRVPPRVKVVGGTDQPVKLRAQL